MARENKKKFKYWQKGAIFSGIIGLIFIIISLTIERVPYENLPEGLGVMFILYIIPLILFGAFIGFLSSLVKNKFIFSGGIIGLMMGVFSILFFENKKFIEIVTYPLNVLNKFVLHISSASKGGGIIFILIHILSLSFAGILVGLIIGKIIGKRKSRR